MSKKPIKRIKKMKKDEWGDGYKAGIRMALDSHQLSIELGQCIFKILDKRYTANNDNDND